jgi:RNA polymerase sigma-70 factor, ECF subfamily
MERVAARDTAAFETIYDRYHRLVHGIAFRMLADVGSADDVTQTVFLKVWRMPQAFRGGNFEAWIARVTRNQTLDVLRAKDVQFADAGEEREDVTESTESAALANADATAVRAALSSLVPEEREPIELAYFGGLTQQRIAERTGIPLGTIKSRMRAALQKMRLVLERSVS